MKYKLAIWLLIASLIAFVLLQSGRYQYDRNYGITNSGPTGTSAFVELLRESGFKVEIRREAATINPGKGESVLIVCSEMSEGKVFSFINSAPKEASYILFRIPMITNVNNSGSVTDVYEERKFGTIVPISTYNPEINWSDITGQTGDEEEEKKIKGQSETLLLASGTQAASVTVERGRKIVTFNESAIITNEHIDKQANAVVAIAAVKTLADPKKPLYVVSQFASDDDSLTLIEKLGPIAHGAWNQLLFLVFIVFLTLCVRFGFPPESRAKQRSSRELAEGIATLLKRKGQHHWAVQAMFEQVIRELEKRYRTSREDILNNPGKYMPEQEIRRLQDIQRRMADPMSAIEAVDLANALKRLV